MKTRSLGLIFIAAVIVPSSLLGVLSVRSASREEAFIEKERATTLDAEVNRVVDLANAEVTAVVEELRAGLSIGATGSPGRALDAWKASHALVSVPFLLSPRYGILWPVSAANPEERRFLRENGDFLSDRATTTVLENIAVRYQAEILAQAAEKSAKSSASSGAAVNAAPRERNAQAEMANAPAASPATGAVENAASQEMPAKGEAANAPAPAPRENVSASPAADGAGENAAAPATGGAATVAAPSASAPSRSMPQTKAAVRAESSASRQVALDAFAQSAEVQKKVYEEAQTRGDTVSPRVVEPAIAPQQAASPGAAPAPAQKPQKQPSQFVVTSQLLSEIASRGDAGIIPRFIGEKLVFLFWSRQKDGRIVGCEIAADALRGRIASVITSTYTPLRILTLLDENGAPLATPPDVKGIDWRRPFVAREIGESLPRWEAAAYLSDPDAIHAQARSSSLVIWILVVILFVSVAGGGTMVLTSVYSEMRLAQKKATFVANVSHELKTPLTSIRLFIDLLRREPPAPPTKRAHYLGMMASEAERLTRLIDNVLDFSRREKGRVRYAMARVDAAAVVAEIVESQRVRLESRGFTVTMSGPTGPAPVITPSPGSTMVVADPEALKQVVLNLLSNAEKYSPERKEIDVGVMRGPAGVAIHVRDRGIGIPAKDSERVFREFVRLDDSLTAPVQGTGLGLTIARRIARDHGGDVTHAPREGGGSDFVVTLPTAGEGA